ncbi:MAG: CDP-diacylglycerol--glycerol-3-phosphate 3-phosphatidyltransferase [Elusimicrobia bacterium]|nr:CDP-diacylglycerol--glycerol-3-phosphate 3-phosphatidyltransferase [Candidatus Liberimonas magnetica]
MNLANKLTLLRIGLVPFLIFCMYLNNFWTRVIALVIFVGAALTDTLDGFIARKLNTVTTLGKFLDPLADKLLISAVLITFVGLRELRIPSWMVVLIISREFIISGLRMHAASKNVIIAAHMSGKFKTTSQMVSIIIVMLILIINAAIWHTKHLTPTQLLSTSAGMKYFIEWCLLMLPYYLMLITTILTVYSGLAYLYEHRDLLRE